MNKLKPKAEDLKEEIRFRYNRRELRLMFGRREDDVLFRSVGRAQKTYLTVSEAVWLGFEILVEAEYLVLPE